MRLFFIGIRGCSHEGHFVSFSQKIVNLSVQLSSTCLTRRLSTPRYRAVLSFGGTHAPAPILFCDIHRTRTVRSLSIRHIDVWQTNEAGANGSTR